MTSVIIRLMLNVPLRYSRQRKPGDYHRVELKLTFRNINAVNCLQRDPKSNLFAFPSRR